MSFRFVSAEERQDLVELRGPLLAGWPEFMFHDPVASACWDLLYERFPAFQHFLLDEDTGEAVADLNSLPVRVDLADLPDRGWDEVMERGTPGVETPNVVTAISVEVLPSRLGEGLSRLCLERMRENASAHGYRDLVAPVRPNWKARYPLVPIDRYIAWTTPEGLPFDPWLRVHARLGASLVRPCPQSMKITGTVAEWEAWAGMAFPESGDYVVPGALEPVSIDRDADLGTYVEPNVWMHHRLAR